MDLIQFPQPSENPPEKGSEFKVSRINVPHDRLLMNGWDVTCHVCGTKSNFETSSMIVRILEFYCRSCGHLHKVTNPAFTSSKKA